MSEIIESNDITIKRSRGRPKKITDKETEPIIINSSSDNEETINERRRGRPRVENPCQSGKPKGGKEYFKEYYASKMKNCLINCPKCNGMTEKANLRNHIKSALCAKIVNHLMNQ